MEKHPKLAEKLKLLYLLQLNPEIKTHTDLARKIGRSKQSVTKWCRGGPTSRGDSIPLDHVSNVADVFSIQSSWFSLPYESFEKKVRKRAHSTKNNSIRPGVRLSTSTLPITDLNLFGRESELNLLNELWVNNKVNVVEIVAFGGAGKSALINKWLSDLSKDNYRGAKKVYAWSFYWQSQSADMRATGDYFIEHALEWFGDPSPASGTPWSKAMRLASLVRKTKSLILLDGLEVLQSPPGESHGLVSSMAISLLLKELAAECPGLCIVTSRYAVADFAAFQDGRVATIRLQRLDQTAGVEMLQSKGLKGSDYQFVEAVESYSGHALSLALLAGYLSIAHSGDLRRIVFMNSVMDGQHNKIHVERIMGDYLQWLEGKYHLQLLTLICLLERVCDLDEILEFVSYDCVVGLTDGLQGVSENSLKYAIKELDDANLISLSKGQQVLEFGCHPLVRDFILNRLRTNNSTTWKRGHELVFCVLRSRAPINPQSKEDFETLFRAVTHGTKAGLFTEAFELYYQRIKQRQFLLFAKGSHHADQACLGGFFDDEWKIKTQELAEDAQVYLLTSAATNLINLGSINQAIVLSRRSIDWFVKNKKWLEASLAAAPLMSMLIASGRLSSAKLLLDELDEVVRFANNSVVTAGANNFRAYVAYLSGDPISAKTWFAESERVLTQLRPVAPAPFPTISAFYCKFLLETGAKWEALERSLKTFAWRRNKSWQALFDTTPLLTWDMLVLGLVFLAIGDRANAKKILDEQLELLRDSEEWLYLPTGLISRARLNIELANFDSANQDLSESIELSKQIGVKFGEWEACLEFAHLYLSMGNKKLGLEYLKQAEAIPEMNQYKFRDLEIRELKDRLN